MYGFIWSVLKEFCIVPADSHKGPANGTQLVFRVSPEPATLTFLASESGAVWKWGTNKPPKFVVWIGKTRYFTILDLGWDHFRTNSKEQQNPCTQKTRERGTISPSASGGSHCKGTIGDGSNIIDGCILMFPMEKWWFIPVYSGYIPNPYGYIHSKLWWYGIPINSSYVTHTHMIYIYICKYIHSNYIHVWPQFLRVKAPFFKAPNAKTLLPKPARQHYPERPGKHRTRHSSPRTAPGQSPFGMGGSDLGKDWEWGESKIDKNSLNKCGIRTLPGVSLYYDAASC